jgi:ribonuclease E
VVAEVAAAPVAEAVAEAPAKPKATRSRAKPKVAEPFVEPTVAEASFPADPVLSEPAPSAALVPDPQDVVASPPTEDGPPKPRKKGWWSAGR